MRANANFQMKNGSPQNAAKMLEELRKNNPDDHQTLAQLISAYSQFDPEKAKRYKKLCYLVILNVKLNKNC